ncbi:hypothetical protein BX286_4234 [Streptomyces sp. 3211.6]|uniref:hypothetical protein n=1 Tax=Streptomyces TaxID=1883 RepID=UPI0009A4F196|nr:MULTISPECIES: hypothetical protein [Streptomyces]RKT06196.1 hypothetical protein BX286_4234 [Streptomyces sp. 3211.6]RPF46267.1 hypothetical protein EDD96_2838 [Streptomyces sp. Ag109_G2-6]
MATNENILPLDGDIRPLDNHASGADVNPLDAPPAEPPAVAKPGEKPLDNHASDLDIVSMDNHASGPRP